MHPSSTAYRNINDWQQEEIFACAETYFDSLLDGIAQAQYSIDLDFYIFELDVLGLKIIDALIAAAQRQVKIRLMIDGLGSGFNARRIAAMLNINNIELRIFHPFPFALNVFRWSNEEGNMLHKFWYFFRRANHRNHHKLCIIDKQCLWTGSFNISAQHLSHKNGGEGWHDYGVKITDNNLQTIVQSFNVLFDKKSLASKKLYLHKIRSNFTEVLRRISNNLLVRRIRNAQHRIWICSAYFSPTHKVLSAIKKAREHGVDVRLILPSISDVFFVPMLSRTYHKKLLQQGVKIYEYQPSVLHAKLMLIDDNCLMGSTNLNHRSFHHDLELDIVLSKPASIQRLEECLLEDMESSKVITLDDIRHQTLTLFFARWFHLFRYWL